MLAWRSIGLVFLVLNIYLIIGMIAFHFLESDHEESVDIDTKKYKEAILSNFTCLSEENLDALVRVIANAIDNGVDPSNSSSSSNWEYHHSFFFSGTVITTIGYGHISPNTRGGRSFCVIYALIGIPICGILLSALADKFNKYKDQILQNVFEKMAKKWHRKAFSLFMILGLGMLFFIFIPAIIFFAIEGWLYYEAVYFCFISLTTVGFGDFVPGQNPDISYPKMYKIMCFYWILLGLVYLAIIIQDVSNAFQEKVEKYDGKKSKMNGIEEGAVEGKEVSSENDSKVHINSTNENTPL